MGIGNKMSGSFPINDSLKTEDGAECFNEDGLIPKAIQILKKEIPEMAIMTDVALDPYRVMDMMA